jgi:hypothetical protein
MRLQVPARVDETASSFLYNCCMIYDILAWNWRCVWFWEVANTLSGSASRQRKTTIATLLKSGEVKPESYQQRQKPSINRTPKLVYAFM